MVTKLPFGSLPESQQARARTMFFDAGASGGYLYELNIDGQVLCRSRATSDWIEGSPPDGIEAAWLRLLSIGPDDDVAYVILATRDDVGWWSRAGRWRADNYTDPVTDEITHWMPYSVPSARL